MNTKKYSKSNTIGVMDGGPIWSAVNYSAYTELGLVRAVIPQSALTRESTIPKLAVQMLRQPTAQNRRKLFIKFGITTAIVSVQTPRPSVPKVEVIAA